jgi:hypothetical protein
LEYSAVGYDLDAGFDLLAHTLGDCLRLPEALSLNHSLSALNVRSHD